MFGTRPVTVSEMLSDRHYMRGDYPREKTSVVTWMLAAIFGAFLLELSLTSHWFDSTNQLVDGLGVTIRGLAHGRLWTFGTHWLLHDPKNLLHVVAVLASLYALGHALEPSLGGKKFIGLFAASLVAGALCWTAVTWRYGGTLLGATAGVYGLLALFACLYPEREFTFLVLFFFPVTVKPRHLLWAIVAIDLCGTVFYDIMRAEAPFGYAPSAHLGGLLVGWTYYRSVYHPGGFFGRTFGASALKSWLNAPPKEVAAAEPEVFAAAVPEAGSRANLRAEVDRILDKINSHGFASLSPDERRVLDEAKDLLSRR